MITSFTYAQNDVLNQLVYLDTHFKSNHGIECFSQSVQQIVRKLGYTRRTIQTALRKLEDAGIITIAYNQGFAGANLFYIHIDKLEELQKKQLEDSTPNEKVRSVFWRFIQDSLIHTNSKPDLQDPEQAADFVAYAHDLYPEHYYEDQTDGCAMAILDVALNGNRWEIKSC